MRPARWSVNAAAFPAPHAAAGRQSGTPTRSTCARRRGQRRRPDRTRAGAGGGTSRRGVRDRRRPSASAGAPQAARVPDPRRHRRGGSGCCGVCTRGRTASGRDPDAVVPAPWPAAWHRPGQHRARGCVPRRSFLPRRVPRDCRSPDREDHRPARIRTRGRRRRARRAAPSGWSRPCEIRAVRRGTSDRPQAGLCGAALRP